MYIGLNSTYKRRFHAFQNSVERLTNDLPELIKQQFPSKEMHSGLKSGGKNQTWGIRTPFASKFSFFEKKLKRSSVFKKVIFSPLCVAIDLPWRGEGRPCLIGLMAPVLSSTEEEWTYRSRLDVNWDLILQNIEMTFLMLASDWWEISNGACA